MMGWVGLLAGSFSHGIHPAEHKTATVSRPIQRVPFVEHYVLPLLQHLGAPARPVVGRGERVRRGQLVAEPGAFVSTALHSPVTGWVREVGPRRYPGGRFEPAIVVEADGYSNQTIEPQPVDVAGMSPEAFIERLQAAGIVGLGGAAFPTHVKFALPEGKRIAHVLVNGAECEPYLTGDHRLMVERPEAVLRGAEIVRAMLGAADITIGVELNKPEAIDALRAHAVPVRSVRVVPLRVKYPQGAEKMLVRAVFGLEVPAGEFPRDVGVTVSNVGTIVAIADCFDAGVPLIERAVTVSGPGVERPSNLIVPIGTPVRELLRFCGGLKPQTREVTMGGPMMGVPLASLDVPVLKSSAGILAFTTEQTARSPEYPCIRCGRCVEACPYFLNPARLARLARARMYDEMRDHHIMDCVECGSCTYSCPSGIPIVQLIRAAKAQLHRHDPAPQ